MSISKFITRKAFPEGDFQNIKANAPNQMSYNIDATRDLVRNQLFNPYAPALAATMSLPYDTMQGIGRAFEGFEPDTGILDYDVVPNAPTFADIGKSIARENPIDSLLGRTYGATLGLGDKLTGYGKSLADMFGSSAMADEPMDVEDFLGTSTPQDLGFIDNAPQIKEAIYQDRVMNKNLPGFASQPQYTIRDQLKRDFLEGGLFRDAKKSLGQTKDAFLEDISGLGKGLGSIKDRAVDIFGSGKELALRGIGSFIGGPIGSFIGGALANLKETPEQKIARGLYDLDDTGTVKSGLMAGYNPVSAFGPTGLSGAMIDRITNIDKTLNNKVISNKTRQVLEARKAKLEAKIAAEQKAMQDYNREQKTGGYQSDFAQDKDFMEGKGTAAEMGSFRYGGIASL